jgi:hypothetical protein
MGRNRGTRASRSKIGDSTKPAPEKKEDPLNALIDQDLLERVGPAIAYARERSEDSSWPIGLCVAWALRQDVSEALVLYARHRVGLGVREVDGWREAKKALRRALVDARIEATCLRPDNGERIPIGASVDRSAH